jgi:hypothetical protein
MLTKLNFITSPLREGESVTCVKQCRCRGVWPCPQPRGYGGALAWGKVHSRKKLSARIWWENGTGCDIGIVCLRRAAEAWMEEPPC